MSSDGSLFLRLSLAGTAQVLLRIAQTGAGADLEKFTPQQDATLRGTAIRALAELAAALSGWIDAKEEEAEAQRNADAEAQEGEAEAAEAAAEGKLAQVWRL